MRVLIRWWRWLFLIGFFAAAVWSHDAGAADGEISLDLGTLTAVGTAIGTVLAGIAGAAWRFWPRGSAPPPAAAAVTLPPQVTLPTPERVPTRSVLIRQIKGDEALQRFGELLPKLERVDWDALDDLGVRLERDRDHLEQKIDAVKAAVDADRTTD